MIEFTFITVLKLAFTLLAMFIACHPGLDRKRRVGAVLAGAAMFISIAFAHPLVTAIHFIGILMLWLPDDDDGDSGMKERDRNWKPKKWWSNKDVWLPTGV